MVIVTTDDTSYAIYHLNYIKTKNIPLSSPHMYIGPLPVYSTTAERRAGITNINKPTVKMGNGINYLRWQHQHPNSIVGIVEETVIQVV